MYKSADYDKNRTVNLSLVHKEFILEQVREKTEGKLRLECRKAIEMVVV